MIILMSINVVVGRRRTITRYKYICLRSRPVSPNVVCKSVSINVENSD